MQPAPSLRADTRGPGWVARSDTAVIPVWVSVSEATHPKRAQAGRRKQDGSRGPGCDRRAGVRVALRRGRAWAGVWEESRAGVRVPGRSPSDSSNSSSARLSRTSGGSGTASNGHPRSAMAPQQYCCPAASCWAGSGPGSRQAQPRWPRATATSLPSAPRPASALGEPRRRAGGRPRRLHRDTGAGTSAGSSSAAATSATAPRVPDSPAGPARSALARWEERQGSARVRRVASLVGAWPRPATPDARCHWLRGRDEAVPDFH